MKVWNRKGYIRKRRTGDSFLGVGGTMGCADPELRPDAAPEAA